MKLSLVQFCCVSIILIVIHSCKKEYSCEGCIHSNKPPLAIAGNDTAIVLTINTLVLNGSASLDPDGKIVSYQWSKLSGPGATNIDNPAMAKTSVKNMTPGIYQFELKVVDDGGLSASDTVQITVNDAIQSIKLPPVANAGNNITVNYDLQSCSITAVTLNGSMSHDPDGTIISYSWTQIPGPAFGPPPATILNPNSATTGVGDLLTGTYSFILKVIDNDQLTGSDTVMITVVGNNRPLINAQLIPVGTLSQTRGGLTVAASGDKIVFAGGWDGTASLSRVDIYNTANQSWQTASLSVPRYAIAAATLGNRIVFAGGYNGDEVNPLTYSAVDVYDVTSNTWSVTSMSQPIGSRSAAVLNDKIYFGGGDHSNGTIGYRDLPAVVDIYNPQTATWSTTTLSEGRFGLSACTANNKIYFAGGLVASGNATDKINIYDGNTWSLSTLAKARSDMACTVAGNKIFWAGGLIMSNGFVQNTTNHVDIKDLTTQTSTFACLSQPNAAFDAVVKNNQIVFFTGDTWIPNKKNQFDIYDTATNTWSIGILDKKIAGASIISVNNTIYVAGGYVNGVLSNQVWKLQF